MQSQLTVLTAILPGQEARLRALLQQLPGGAESPFGAQGTLGRTHYARFAVIDRLDLEPENPDPDRLSAPYLLFSAVVDGSEDSYLEALSRTMSPQLAAVWRCCVDYECKEKQGRLSEYFKRHKQGVTYLFHGYYASVDAVRDALKNRKRMIEFVQKAQFLGAAEQRRSFRVTFETGPDEDAPGGGGSA